MTDPLATLLLIWAVFGRVDSWCEPVLHIGGIPRPAPLYAECINDED